MYANYIKLAVRNMAKNRLYAVINIIGLAIGLAVFLMSSIMVSYEQDHDSMFAKRDRIFTLGSVFAADADILVLETDSVYTALTPLIRNDLHDVEAMARTVRWEYLVSLDDGADSYYQSIRFADPELLEIFDFEYLYGDASALSDPSGVVLVESVANKFFGTTDVLGRVVSLDHKHDLHVTAVIADIPADSHFSSGLFDDDQPMILAPLSLLEKIDDRDLGLNWNRLSMGDLTYVLLPEGRDRYWLEEQVNAVYQRNAPSDQLEFIPTLRVRPLVEVNTMVWDAIGFPVLQTVRLLGLLVLVIACVNYTNLATAQSLGRAREVGLRKTFGATQNQLLVQFMVESLTTVVLAMLLAIACMEIVLPAFNDWANKSVSLDYLAIAPFLLQTTFLVTIAAGAYPAFLITRASPIENLSNTLLRGNGGNLFRSAMIGIQFAISIFMLASVMVMYLQNKLVEESSDVFAKSSIVVLDRVGVQEISLRHDTLQRELLALPGVEAVGFSSQVPYQQSTSGTEVSRAKGDESSSMMMTTISISPDFMEVYDIPLLRGRSLTRDISNDVQTEDSTQVNVLVNQLALSSLGFAGEEEALGQSYFSIPGEQSESESIQYTIVGVVPDRNFLGLHNNTKPRAFFLEPSNLGVASIRVRGEDLNRTLSDIENVWDGVNPDYPIQLRFLDEVFEEFFSIFTVMNKALAWFAVLALSLALIGLFGLAAFMAERRTKEIGVRKILGARVDQIVRLLIWQFSIPVLWSLLIAIPAAWFASGFYLNSFSERIDMLPLIIALAGCLGLIMAWCIVAGHAIKIACANPVNSLRYE